MAKADSYAKQLNICDFTANEGWLACLKKRRGLVHMGKPKVKMRIPEMNGSSSYISGIPINQRRSAIRMRQVSTTVPCQVRIKFSP